MTLEAGASRLVGNDPVRILAGFEASRNGSWAEPTRVPLWDGKAGERIGRRLEAWLDLA